MNGYTNNSGVMADVNPLKNANVGNVNIRKPNRRISLLKLFVNEELIGLIQSVSIKKDKDSSRIEIERYVLNSPGSFLRIANLIDMINIRIDIIDNSKNNFIYSENDITTERYLLNNASIAEYERNYEVDSEGCHHDKEFITFASKDLTFATEVDNGEPGV